MSASQAEKIIRFQNLYKTYSTLLFSDPTDRPIAVGGIQRRLLEAFGTREGYGVFDEDVRTGQLGLLRRSLLWHCVSDDEIRPGFSRIDFPPDDSGTAIVIPSWSWMAYTGEIDFIKLDFGAIDWVKIQSPWGAEKSDTTARFDDGRKNLALKARIRKINVSPDDAMTVGRLYFDDPELPKNDNELLCAVLGVDKAGTGASERFHYFILLERGISSGPDQCGTYERSGAGYLPESCLGPEMEWVDIY